MPDERLLESERAKVRHEYEKELDRLKQEMAAEKQSNALLQSSMKQLKTKYEHEIHNVNTRLASAAKLANAASAVSIRESRCCKGG